MSDADMVERVARALCKADGYTHPDEDWTSTTNGSPNVVSPSVALAPGKEQRWRTFERRARFAIRAMRVPTPKMYNAYGGPEASRQCWMAMIDEALK